MRPRRSVMPLAVELVREADEVAQTGDPYPVALAIERMTAGWTTSERLRLMTAVTLLASHLASRLDEATRHEVLRLATVNS